jgi:hypothetical protein
MTTPIKTAAAQHILAIDLGKYKSLACHYHQSSQEVALATIDTTQIVLAKQLTKRWPDDVMIEGRASSSRFHDLCTELGLRCRVANTTNASPASFTVWDKA